MFFRKSRLKKALLLIITRYGLTSRDNEFINTELGELGIKLISSGTNDNVITNVIVKSNLLGVIFEIESNELCVYYGKLWPLYKAIIKISNDAKRLTIIRKIDKIKERNKLFDEHMENFDPKIFKITNKIIN